MAGKDPKNMDRLYFVLTIVVIIAIFLTLLTIFGCFTPQEAAVVKEVVDVAYDAAPVNTIVKEIFRPLWEMGALYVIGLLTIPSAKGAGKVAKKAVAGMKNRKQKA